MTRDEVMKVAGDVVAVVVPIFRPHIEYFDETEQATEAIATVIQQTFEREQSPVIYHSRHTAPPKTRPFLALCTTFTFDGFGNPPRKGEPTWKEIYWVDGRWSVYCGFDRVWSTAVVGFTYWMESPTKPSS